MTLGLRFGKFRERIPVSLLYNELVVRPVKGGDPSSLPYLEVD